jgi:hypothetical protein
LQLNKEIQALFQLIDDPDNEVFETVAHQLLQYGKEIVPSLEYLWESAEEENVQERIALLIHRVHFKELQKELSDWCDAEQPELLRGAIIVAQYQYPELNIPFLLTQFEQIRKNLWLELNNYLTPIEKVNTFNGILYNYYKLQGHELKEKNPDHFFINKTLESKQGNVFTIGVLYLALAELLDIPIYAVAIPQQFLLAYVDTLQHFYSIGDETLRRVSFFIDMVGGMIYTQNDVEFYLQKMHCDPKNPQYYEEQNTVQIIYQLLEELSQCYKHHNMEDKADDINLLMQILEPKMA